MNQLNPIKLAGAFVALAFFTSACGEKAADKLTDIKSDSSATVAAKPDRAKLKAEIQEQETAFAVADNARDAKTIASFYAEDAVTMGDDQPGIVGREAIQKDIETYLGKRAKGSTVSYDVQDAYGDDNYVTEVGKTTRKDSTGKVLSTGKYMAIWEKRNGKWICIRDIANDDAKEK
jgi:uncharacterized protein (TIGR02246 family)